GGCRAPPISPPFAYATLFRSYRDRLQELELDLQQGRVTEQEFNQLKAELELTLLDDVAVNRDDQAARSAGGKFIVWPLLILIPRSEEHTSELQSRENLVCRLL